MGQRREEIVQIQILDVSALTNVLCVQFDGVNCVCPGLRAGIGFGVRLYWFRGTLLRLFEFGWAVCGAWLGWL